MNRLISRMRFYNRAFRKVSERLRRILFRGCTINEFAMTEPVLPEMKGICLARRVRGHLALAGWTNSARAFLCENS
ncbi:MAG: hypothetical protein JWQ49_6678 [Edaphobacter sp.]|nr:hypothetical protein [Edaphobacter sp.]